MTRVAGQWPIYTAGRVGALERAAEAEASAAGADLDTARADLRFEVTRAYWAVATSTEAVRVLKESVARAESQVRDARQRLDVGLVPPSDVLTFEAQQSSEELQLIEATNLLESSLIDLRRLIGADPDAAIEISDRLDTPLGSGTIPPQNAAEAATLVSEALKQRPELQALAFRIEGAQARQAAAGTGNKPTVVLGAGYDFAKPNAKIFPREDVWQTVVGRRRQLQLDVLRQRPHPRRSGRGRRQRACHRGAPEGPGHGGLGRRPAAASRSPLEPGRGPRRRDRRPRRDRGPAGPRRPLRRRRRHHHRRPGRAGALLAAELARARAFASVRLAEARLQRAVGRP